MTCGSVIINLVGFFSRIPPEVKTARTAWSRGDHYYQCGVQLSAEVNPNVLLNQVAAEGWRVQSFVVVFEAGVPHSIYMFERPQPRE